MEEKQLRAMPKIELHCHLDGSLSLSTLRRLAELGDVPLPESDDELREQVTAPADCESLARYLTRFELPLRCLQTAEGLRIAACSLLEDVSAENVLYIEVRFAPMLSLEGGLTPEEVVEAVLEGLAQGREQFGVQWGALLIAMRNHTVEQNLEVVNLADRYQDAGVVGLDLAGDEAGYPPDLSDAVFHRAHDLDIPFTLHAGEVGNAESIRQALALRPRRIGHGIALAKDPDLLEQCVEAGIGVEICPCSNLQTKAAEDWESYPFPQFYEKGLALSVNTDNRTVTGTTLTAEFAALDAHFAITPSDVRQLTLSAVASSFAPIEVKEFLWREVQAYYSE